MSTESASTKAGSAGDDEPVPKLPRGRGMKFSGPQIARIAMTLVTLVGVMFLAKPCANAVSNFVMSYEQGSGSAMPKPGNVDMPVGTGQYEQLKPGMSEAEIKAAMERAKAKQRGGAVEQGSAAPAGSATPSSGSATPSSGSATLDPAPPSPTTQPQTTP
ncbi:MAG: hypothetical protein HOV81_41315 [Kofleriaceae bacterium]|nr:hypothetical protein [Kofleriaceae bacterium]